MRKIMLVIAAIAALAVAVPTAASAAPAAHRAHAVYIRFAGTRRCVTALHDRPGAAVVAQRCRRMPDQRWVIRHGAVRLAGTRLRLAVTRAPWRAVLARRGTAWRLGRRHHLADVALSRRERALMVMTLPRGGRRVVVSQFLPVISTPIFVQDPGYQGVRLSQAAR